MPRRQFVADGICDVVESKQAALFGELRMKDDLKEQIPELLAKRDVVAPIDGVRHLVGFFDGIGRNRFKRLFAIPGTTTVRIPQASHHFEQAFDG